MFKLNFPFIRMLVVLVIAAVIMSTIPVPVSAATNLITYPGPAGITPSNLFSVRVNNGSTWQNSFTYYSGTYTPASYHWDSSSYTVFDFSDGDVTVEVSIPNGTITSAEIRPLSAHITPAISNGKLTFTLSSPRKLMICVNGDRENYLAVLSGSPVMAPSPSDPNVIYYGPGVHNVGDITIPAGKSLYLAGGAYVKSQKITSNSASTRIYGHGVLSGESYTPADTNQALVYLIGDYCTIEGITIANYRVTYSAWIQGHHGTANDLRILGNNKYNSGGNAGVWIMDQFEYGVIDNCFMVCMDDTVYLPGSHGQILNTYGANNQVSAGLQLTWHSPVDKRYILVDGLETWSRNLINHHYAQAAIWSPYAGGAIVGDITIRNSTFECENSRFLGLAIMDHAWDVDPGLYGNIQDITFQDCEVIGTFGSYQNILSGRDATHTVHDIQFNNLKINGNYVNSAAEGNFNMNSYVYGITFSAPDDGSNYVTNPSFELNGGPGTDPSGWSSWTDTGDYDADYVPDDWAHSGTYCLAHYKPSDPYRIDTYQMVTGLPNGTYTLDAWVLSSGGQNAAKIYAKKYGEADKYVNIPQASQWTQISISNINVTNGQCSIEIWSDAPAGKWIRVDDVQLTKQ